MNHYLTLPTNGIFKKKGSFSSSEWGVRLEIWNFPTKYDNPEDIDTLEEVAGTGGHVRNFPFLGYSSFYNAIPPLSRDGQ